MIGDRDVTLSGLLSDGTPFNFDLNSTDIRGKDFFDPHATLTVTLVPEPATLQLLIVAVGIVLGRVGRCAKTQLCVRHVKKGPL